MTQTTVTVTEVRGTELYRRYPGQTQPQDCYVELDCTDGELSASYNAEIGNAVPERVYLGRAIRYAIPCLRAAVANALLREILPLAERVVAGYEKIWDGSNHVGRLSEDAQSASDEIELLCSSADEDGDSVSVWDGDYLYDDIKRISALPADQWAAEITKIAAGAESEGAVIDIDMEREIREYAGQ